MEPTISTWLLPMTALVLIGVRVYFDAVHRTRAQRLGWATFSVLVPVIGFVAFLYHRASRHSRPAI